MVVSLSYPALSPTDHKDLFLQPTFPQPILLFYPLTPVAIHWEHHLSSTGKEASSLKTLTIPSLLSNPDSWPYLPHCNRTLAAAFLCPMHTPPVNTTVHPPLPSLSIFIAWGQTSILAGICLLTQVTFPMVTCRLKVDPHLHYCSWDQISLVSSLIPNSVAENLLWSLFTF